MGEVEPSRIVPACNHNPEVGGSSPPPATNIFNGLGDIRLTHLSLGKQEVSLQTRFGAVGDTGPPCCCGSPFGPLEGADARQQRVPVPLP